FGMSKFIVCTDAGLSSATNRVFNTYDKEDGMRGFITTQPIKTLKAFFNAILENYFLKFSKLNEEFLFQSKSRSKSNDLLLNLTISYLTK
ncbi:MAG: hypothetical protein IIV69_00375, partial [Peptococcaceae bacterium]|nr:hypothetical protein [Peptococcaceae bacterium]